MRALRLLASPALLGFLVLVVSGAPALSGCDSGGFQSPDACESDDAFATEDLTPEGTDLGATIAVGNCVAVDYVGRLADGSGTFDEGSLTFRYSANSGLIYGFVLGMNEQRVGETRRVTIPPELAYGAQPRDARSDDYVGIPACSTLEFDITLRAIYQDTRQCQR